jgi:hypothetical protein
MVKSVHALQKRPESSLYQLAQSKFVAADLDQLGITYLRRNVSPANPDVFKPEPLGSKVYIYGGDSAGTRAEFYGLDRLPEIMARLPEVDFVVGHTSPPTYPHGQMPEVYRDCLMGLRLTPHDGCSGTVVELGLMGRRCVWNGDLPSAIPWKTTDDIVSAIRNELPLVGRMNEDLGAQTRSALSNLDWLYTEAYQKEQGPIQKMTHLANGMLNRLLRRG